MQIQETNYNAQSTRFRKGEAKTCFLYAKFEPDVYLVLVQVHRSMNNYLVS